MNLLTIKVVKSHDGIQQGETLRFAECPVIRQMIADGYYQLVKTESVEDKNEVSKAEVKQAEENAAVTTVKNIVKRFRRK